MTIVVPALIYLLVPEYTAVLLPPFALLMAMRAERASSSV
jgi:hypothetical protein